MASKRPTLADIGSLSLSVRTVPLPGKPHPTVSPSAQVLLSNVSAAEPSEEIPDLSMEIDAVCPQPPEIPPLVPLMASDGTATPTAPRSPIQVTRQDKIEAALQEIDPAIRAFIEDELRGRFVAVVSTGGSGS